MIELRFVERIIEFNKIYQSVEKILQYREIPGGTIPSVFDIAWKDVPNVGVIDENKD